MRNCLQEMVKCVQETYDGEVISDFMRELLCHFDSVKVINQLYECLFNFKVMIQHHRKFQTDVMFQANFDFMPKSLFCNVLKDKGHMACIGYEVCKTWTSIIPRSLISFWKPNDSFELFFFYGPHHFDCEMKWLICLLLQKYAHMPESSALEIAVGFLFSIKDQHQDPHVDYAHVALDRYREKSRHKKYDYDILPWSMDMPLTDGSMCLAFYGPKDNLSHIPAPVHVPLWSILFWHGDCLHAGSFADLLGRHGF